MQSHNMQMQRIWEQVQKFAPTDATVIIQGESGTGKEVLAQRIHQLSRRSEGPFIKVDCTAVPRDLMESELFGYEEGAFTGARRGGKPGKFDAAHGGTMFLDEIGDLPQALQAKLLRVLEERRYDPVGGTRTRQVDVRIIVATNHNLQQLVQEERFRLDLYQRLNVFVVQLPPLRERREDIQELTTELLTAICQEQSRPLPVLSPEVKAALLGHDWPGNVRELRNALTRALTLADGGTLEAEHLPDSILPAAPGRQPLLKAYVESAECTLLRWVLADIARKEDAAVRLGISRAALYKKLNRCGLLSTTARRTR